MYLIMSMGNQKENMSGIKKKNTQVKIINTKKEEGRITKIIKKKYRKGKEET